MGEPLCLPDGGGGMNPGGHPAGNHFNGPCIGMLWGRGPRGHACLCSGRFSDVILATILATKSEMCGKKFELKIDNVRFVGHPTLLQHAFGQVGWVGGGEGDPLLGGGGLCTEERAGAGRCGRSSFPRGVQQGLPCGQASPAKDPPPLSLAAS